MTRTAKHHAIPALVDVKQGLVSRELFVNEELYQYGRGGHGSQKREAQR